MDQPQPGGPPAFVLQKFYFYQTKMRYYCVGHSKSRSHWQVLKISRTTETPTLDATEDVGVYSKNEVTTLLKSIHDGNLAHGGLQLVCQVYGIIGCFRFLEGYYLLLITKRRYAGVICGHKVYSVADTALIPLLHPTTQQEPGLESAAEKRYRRLLLTGLDLSSGQFFFSHTYTLSRTLQANLTAKAPLGPFNSMFVWNEFLTRPLREGLGSERWTVPLVHGFFQQRTLAVFGRTLTLTLLARRSKYFAGTRYRKRGISDQGRVANDVETEQLLDAGHNRRTGLPILSSVVQVRGSIPLYWTQEGSKLKPDILLQQYDPLYGATRKHFRDLRQRYGDPIVVLNLVKSSEKRPRETILRREFGNAVTYLNQQVPPAQRITYIPWDFNFYAKQRGADILSEITPVVQTCLSSTGFFTYGADRPGKGAAGAAPAGEAPVSMQTGVVRTNCIDCLDRTNVAQFAYGLVALGRQLQALGVSDSPAIDAQSSVARQLMEMHEVAGNTLAQQYGGSEAHSTFFQRQRGDWEPATQSRDLMTSIRRFYSNTYTDAEKQDAINLFLGNFVPHPHRPPLWELDSDYYLHTTSASRKPSMDGSLSGSDRSGSTASTLSAATSAEPLSDSPFAPAAANMAPPDAVASGKLPAERQGSTIVVVEPSAAEVATVQEPSMPRAEAEPAPADDPPSAADAAVADAASAGTAEQQSSATPALAAPAAPHAAFQVVPPKRLKLESFDKMIGKQPNTIHAVRLHAPPQQRAYLPLWLASPLGIRPRTRGRGAPLAPVAEGDLRRVTDASGSSSSASARSSLTGMTMAPPPPPPPGLRRTVSSEAGLAGSPFPNRLALQGHSMCRRSADFAGDGRGGLAPVPMAALPQVQRRGTPPLDVAPAPAGRREGLLSCPASPPMKYRAFATAAAEAVAGMSGAAVPSTQEHTAARSPAPPARLPARARRLSFPTLSRTSEEVTAAVAAAQATPVASAASKPGAATARGAPLSSARSAPLLSDTASKAAVPGLESVLYAADAVRAGRDSLGLAEGMLAWWLAAGAAAPSSAWYEDEQRTRDTYARYLTEVQSQLAQSHAWEAERLYASLCNPPVTVSLQGFTGGEASAWRRSAGLLGTRTFSEAELRTLTGVAQELGPSPVLAA